MSALDWSSEDLVIGRADAVVLNYAYVRQLANEDLDEEFHSGELLEEEGLSRPALRTSLQRLVERGWLTARVENAFTARSEGRPPRTYYRLSGTGRQVVDAILRPPPGAAARPR